MIRIGAIRRLTAEDEAALARRRDDPASDPEARLAARDELIARNLPLALERARSWSRDRPRWRDAIRSAAFISLIRAAEAFDPARGRFSTVARTTMDRAIMNALDRESRVIAGRLGDRVLSLDLPDADGETIAAVLTAPRGPDGPDYGPAALARLRDAMDALPPRWAEVVRRRHADPPEHMSSIGADLGVSKSRVEQLERKALARLRQLIGEGAARA